MKTKIWLQHHFIPHESNHHRPHLLTKENIRDIIGLLFFFELILFVIPVLNYSRIAQNSNLGAVITSDLSAYSNIERANAGVAALKENPLLDQAATLKAEDMASKGYFAHTSPEGFTPWYWFNQVGYPYLFAGENLAVNFVDSRDVTDAWMNSPLHKANIINSNYTEIGTGIATGMYKGREAVFVVQLYGSEIPTLSSAAIGTLPIITAHNIWQQVILAPEQAIAVALFIVLILILVALYLNIFIKFEHQHPDLIRNALLVVVIIFGLQLANVYIAKKNLETTLVSSHIGYNSFQWQRVESR